MLGIGIVLVGFGWYMGLGDMLLGELAGEKEAIVRITAEGTFDPAEIAVRPGQSVKIMNEHDDPQVLKTGNGREIFPTMILYKDEEAMIEIPDDALGPYTYISETLPAEQSITFSVALPEAQNPVTETDGTEEPIPIPFGNAENPIAAEPETPTNTDPVVTVHESGPATISLTGNTTSSAASTASPSPATKTTIPMNPYTVHATGADKQVAYNQAVASANEELHSGAPLQQYAQYRPPATSETGPEHVAIIVMLLSGALFWPVARRMMRA